MIVMISSRARARFNEEVYSIEPLKILTFHDCTARAVAPDLETLEHPRLRIPSRGEGSTWEPKLIEDLGTAAVLRDVFDVNVPSDLPMNFKTPKDARGTIYKNKQNSL